MLRIHFTAEDLARTRVAAGPQVGVELTCSLWRLAIRQNPPLLGRWLPSLRGRLDRRTALLLDLATDDYVADVVGAYVSGEDPDEVFEAIRSAGQDEFRGGIARLGRHRPLSTFARRLGDGEAQAVRAFGDAVVSFYRTGISPYWKGIRTVGDADRAHRGRILLDGGVERLLSTLHPHLRWRSGVLNAPLCTTFDGDVHLGGHGLVLVPSVFAGSRPVLIDITRRPLVLAYPVTAGAPTTAAKPLEALLGRTRAAVLSVVADGDASTTSEIARRLSISPASASTHAAVLRGAGLITTRRSGNQVLHTATANGLDLLNG
jgi:DNA-binding transcriptional ArsR family regulator